MTPRTYIELAAGVVLIIAFGLFVKHERTVGETKVHTADAKALSEARKRADAETAMNVSKAVQADEVAAHAQEAVDDYRAANPVGPVRLCNQNNSQPILPTAGTHPGKPQSAGTQPPMVQPVPDGNPGPDISGRLDTIVRAAQQLAIENGQWQSR